MLEKNPKNLQIKYFTIPVPQNVVRGTDQMVAVVPMVTEFAVHVRRIKTVKSQVRSIRSTGKIFQIAYEGDF